MKLVRNTWIPLCLVSIACSESATPSNGARGRAGSGGSDEGLVPLPEGSRKLDGIVNLVDATAAAELEAFIGAPTSEPHDAGVLTTALNLFFERYVEAYDFVYFMTDHPLDAGAFGRFEAVTQPAMPGIGRDVVWEREGYKNLCVIALSLVVLRYVTSNHVRVG